MSTPEEKLRLLRRFNAAVQGADPDLHEESRDTARPELEAYKSVDSAIEEESIVMRQLRPVLAIKQHEVALEFQDASESAVWRSRLEKARPALSLAAKAVGRIELDGNPDFSWVGTGWLVAPDVIVTNRHVAELFAARGGQGFVFQPGLNGDQRASLDFLQEIDCTETQVFRLTAVLHIEDRPGPDLAFLSIDQTGGQLAAPLRLASKPSTTLNAATLGYPAYDSRVPEPDLMRRIYRDTYDKKRLAPGAVTSVEQERLLHDCTTLGGNSGSAVLDLDSGEVLGLHFSGSFLRTNYAVRSDIVTRRLEDLRSNRLTVGPRPSTLSRPAQQGERGPERRPSGGGAARGGASASATSSASTSTTVTASTSASVTIPLTITVSLGEPARRPARPPRPRIAGTGDDDVEVATEATVDDYKGRKGYQADFLGKRFAIPLPDTSVHADDLLVFGTEETVLRYEHFSLEMSKSRRMCRYSAVNIDGKLSKKSKRAQWKWDPRIPRSQQIMKECYGDSPKFSRGHMTRREDPSWGATAEIAKRGNDDSMHVTNTTPQMQSFNSPIWLGLEDYALDNAREDDMRISVFTGPYLDDNDPVYYGVQIPVAFWKIIAFIHDETGELCATGYEMSQEDNLEQPEFVFGDYVSAQLNTSTQVPISAIEARSGLRFGDLASHDPLSQEGPDRGPRGPLVSFGQIRFR